MKLAPFALHLVGGLSLVGCATSPNLGETESASTVDTYAGRRLLDGGRHRPRRADRQEAACIDADSFIQFPTSTNITLTSNAVLPYLVKGAATDLASDAVGHSLQINSALRTIAQQYLLYRWYSGGRCGITAAATSVTRTTRAGARSISRTGRIACSRCRRTAGRHDVAGDPVHFDHT